MMPDVEWMQEHLEVAWLDANLDTDFKIILFREAEMKKKKRTVLTSLSQCQKKSYMCKVFSFS